MAIIMSSWPADEELPAPAGMPSVYSGTGALGALTTRKMSESSFLSCSHARSGTTTVGGGAGAVVAWAAKSLALCWVLSRANSAEAGATGIIHLVAYEQARTFALSIKMRISVHSRTI